jgi:hypothetical protein
VVQGKIALNIEEKRSQRFQFLYALYNLTDGKEHSYKDTLEVGKVCGFNQDIVFNVVAYLKGEGLSQVSYLMSSYHLPNRLSKYSDTAAFCSSICS